MVYVPLRRTGYKYKNLDTVITHHAKLCSAFAIFPSKFAFQIMDNFVIIARNIVKIRDVLRDVL